MTIHKLPVVNALKYTLGECFTKIAYIGRLTLFQHKDGTWSAKCEVPTDNKAVTAEIRSGWQHDSAESALNALIQNAGDAGGTPS